MEGKWLLWFEATTTFIQSMSLRSVWKEVCFLSPKNVLDNCFRAQNTHYTLNIWQYSNAMEILLHVRGTRYFQEITCWALTQPLMAFICSMVLKIQPFFCYWQFKSCRFSQQIRYERNHHFCHLHSLRAMEFNFHKICHAHRIHFLPHSFCQHLITIELTSISQREMKDVR